MRSARHLVALCASVALGVLTTGAAHADDPPKYDFGKKDDAKEVIWKASAQVGASGAYGNAQTVTVTGGINLSRNDGANKVSFDAGGLYTQAWVRNATAVDNPVPGSMPPKGDGVIDNSEQQQSRASTQAAANWLARLRYDRFFTERNAGYLTVFAGQDYVGLKSLLTGGQLGYSRLLLKSEMHELAAEVGYDLNYTRFTTEGVDPVLIHSARLFLGYLFTISKETAINASVRRSSTATPSRSGCPPWRPMTRTPRRASGRRAAWSAAGVDHGDLQERELQVRTHHPVRQCPRPAGQAARHDRAGGGRRR